VPADRLEVIYPGVDLDYFVPNGDSKPFFLLPGRIMWTKNIELGIEALRQLRAADPAAGKYRLVIAGVVDEKSRPYLAFLKQLAEGIQDIEFVVDPSDTLYKELHQRCKAVLFTPLNEDWGFVPLEAMATEKPVIAVSQGGPAESVVDGQTGYLVAPRAQEFASAMSRLIEDPALTRRMGLAGRARAGEFTWGKFVSRIDDYIDSLGNGKADRTNPAETALR
jgi:glycosyltransferase involved in cell wall biosynthesis